MITYFSFY